MRSFFSFKTTSLLAVGEAGAGHVEEAAEAVGPVQGAVAACRPARPARLPCRAAREPQPDPRPAVARQRGLALARAGQHNRAWVRVARDPELVWVELAQVSQQGPGLLPAK